MSKKVALVLMIMVIGFMLTSCRGAYPRPEFVYFANPPAPRQVLDDFRKKNIEACSLYQTAVIEIKGKSIAAIGFCAFDADKGDIALSLMSTTGMKFIEIAEFNGKKSSVFTLPDVASEEQAALRIGEDIKRIFIQPKGDPKDYQLTSSSLSFGWLDKDLRTELIFGRSPEKDIDGLLLLGKKIYVKDSLAGEVYYYDYKNLHGKLVPMRIRYENQNFDYNLTLKTKEVSYGKKSDTQ